MAFFYKYEYTNKSKNIHPWVSMKKKTLTSIQNPFYRYLTIGFGPHTSSLRTLWSTKISYVLHGPLKFN